MLLLEPKSTNVYIPLATFEKCMMRGGEAGKGGLLTGRDLNLAKVVVDSATQS